MKRSLYLTGVIALCAWTLVPIYFLALGALGGRDLVNTFPKPFWPGSASFATIRDFLAIDGVTAATIVSVETACLTMVFALLLGLPAGYALARFSFPGSGLFRLLILLTRAFPVAILALPLTVGFIQELLRRVQRRDDLLLHPTPYQRPWQEGLQLHADSR